MDRNLWSDIQLTAKVKLDDRSIESLSLFVTILLVNFGLLLKQSKLC